MVSDLSFADYINDCQSHIAAQRGRYPAQYPGHPNTIISPDHIVHANSPFEFQPSQAATGQRAKYGALLIHGLLDSPFTMRDIGTYLQTHHMLARSVLLPGHGTHPADLLQVTYQDWIDTVRYGIESLRREADHIYLIGYSTGATLSLYHAMQDADIAGVVLISPAIQLQSPIDLALKCKQWMPWASKHREWLYRSQEVDYVKYQSVPNNALTQLSSLMSLMHQQHGAQPIACPIFMALSQDDETISSQAAIDFFANTTHPQSQALLYASTRARHADPRIVTHYISYPELHIQHFSHTSIPFAPNNPHYGQAGDYPFAAHSELADVIYGAFNVMKSGVFDQLHQWGITKIKRRELTYNPDFQRMMDSMIKFMLAS